MTLDDLRLALDEVGLEHDEADTDPTRQADVALHRSRSALGPLQWTLGVEVRGTVLGVGLLVWFLATHSGSPWPAVASAGLLLAAELAHLGATVRQLVALQRVHFAAPVVAVQRRLAALYALRSRVVRNALLAAPLAWLPMLIVAAEWGLGVDVVAVASPAWVASNLALGVAVLAGGLWVAHRRPEWVEASPGLRRMADHLAGRSLRRAKEHADEAAAFERDLEA